MEFVLVGTFKKTRVNIERLIKKLGGRAGTEINNRVTAIVSTVNEVQKMDKEMIEARKHNIQVVSEEFLDEIQTPDVDPIFYIISKSISDWGGDVSTYLNRILRCAWTWFYLSIFNLTYNFSHMRVSNKMM